MKTALLLIALFFGMNGWSQRSSDSAYLFCYFKGNGDGLHYAYSEDGYKWKTLFNDSSVLKPTVSKDKLFRDPCIIKGPDGKYHMVWTVSWADKGIGYASSADLLHWSEQRFIPVMMHEDSARIHGRRRLITMLKRNSTSCIGPPPSRGALHKKIHRLKGKRTTTAFTTQPRKILKHGAEQSFCTSRASA